MKYKGFEEVRRCWMTLIGTLFLGLLGGRQARRMVSIMAIEKQIEGEKEERRDDGGAWAGVSEE